MKTRDLYMPNLSNALKAHAGEKYRPSNGVEGDKFQSLWCEDCTKDNDNRCLIIGASFYFGIDDPEYPIEWCYGEDGQPKCTAFEEKPEAEQETPEPEDDLTAYKRDADAKGER